MLPCHILDTYLTPFSLYRYQVLYGHRDFSIYQVLQQLVETNGILIIFQNVPTPKNINKHIVGLAPLPSNLYWLTLYLIAVEGEQHNFNT